MNQTFSLTRFARMHRWLWATKARTYLIGIAVLAIVGCLSLSRVMNDEEHTYNVFIYQGHLIFFILLSLVLTVGIGSDIFSTLFRQESAITYLMLPASRSEKFWLGALYCLVALLTFSAIYFGYERFAFSVTNAQLKPGQTHYASSLVHFKPDFGVGNLGIYAVFYVLLLLLAVALLGSFYFRRGVLVRNIGVILFLLFSLTYLYLTIVGMLFRGFDPSGGVPFGNLHVRDGRHSYELYTPNWLTYAVYGVTLLTLWVTARIRFNELER